jgi:glycosyltransferase involved in cell wall biosynthesis
VCGSATYDGTAIYAWRLAQSQIEHVHASLLFLYNGSAFKEMSLKELNLFCLFKHNKINWYYNFTKIYLLRKYFKNTNYDIIHYHSGGVIVIVFLYICFKHKLILHIHCGNITGSNKISSKFLSYPFRYIIKRSVVIFVSKRLNNLASLKYGDSNNFYLVRNAVPKENLQSNEKNHFGLGFLGQLMEEKGLELLVDIAEEFLKINDKVIFFVKGDIKVQSKKLIKILFNLPNIIILKPSLDNSEFWENVNVLLFLSQMEEGCPLVLLESLSYNVPVIGKNTLVLRELFGEYPLLLDNLNTINVIYLINKILKKESIVINLTKIHTEINLKYDFNRMLAEINNIYVKVSPSLFTSSY